jgi:thiol-disulfide isomerase/thioredoxin
MTPTRRTFLAGLVLGLLVGFAAGVTALGGFLGYAQRVLRERAEARHSTRTRPTPGGFLEPELAFLPSQEPFDFSVRVERPDGTSGNLQDLRGKVVVLNLWATWCAPCIAELPDLEALRARFKNDSRIAFVAVSKDSREAFRGYLERWRHELPLLRLADDATIAAAGDAVPVTVVIDANARVVAVQRGAAKWNGDRAYHYLQALLAKTTAARVAS